MFKIESYITPILMNYVAKYVKNIRPQDAQLSLWSGEVALQNLDLRLDVLEDELQLPFEFLSGHIHELIIHVPWTKITSEPIQITINTIEFVLKLKDLNSKSTTSTATGNTGSTTTIGSNGLPHTGNINNTNDLLTSPSSGIIIGGNGGSSVSQNDGNNERKKKISKLEDTTQVQQQQQQQQQGYVPGLVNKIINNIAINCHNIILKYVEDDIVVSMNVQLLSFNSADLNWNKSFCDINQNRVVLRKLIQISDLTICLDKRNSIGLIDVCQEPILYRCSLEMRMYKKYNTTTMKNSSYTRIDIYSKLMEINISSIQFPMVMRLLILMKILKDGDLNRKSETMKRTTTTAGATAAAGGGNNGDGSDGGSGGGGSGGSGTGDVDTSKTDLINNNDDNSNSNILTTESYLSWAWNLLPSVFPSETDTIENDENKIGHIFNIGIYLSKLNITLKFSELFIDSIVQSTRKIRYNPIMKISFEGIYSETLIIDRKWFNTTAGVTKLYLEPLGNYALPLNNNRHHQSSSCGGKSSSNDFDSFLIFTNFTTDSDNYLEKSLFYNKNKNNDKNLLDPILIKSKLNLDNHLNNITEDYLLNRTPAFAFDMIHFIDIPDDFKSDDNGSDFEYSNLSEQLLIRCYLSSITIRYNTNTIKIINSIKDLISTYNYLPYINDKHHEKLSVKILPPSIDDFDALMNEIPKSQYDFKVKQLQIEIHPININDLQKINTGNGNSVGVTNTNNGCGGGSTGGGGGGGGGVGGCTVKQKRLNSTSSTSSLYHLQSQQNLQNQKFCYLNLNLDLLNFNWTHPLYPNRLVYLTSQLPDRPKKLMNSCYDQYQFNLKKFYLQLIQSNNNENDNNGNNTDNDELNHKINILYIPEINGYLNLIIKPNIWSKNSNIIFQKFHCNINEITLKFTKYELIILCKLFDLIQFPSENLNNKKLKMKKFNIYHLYEILNLNHLLIQNRNNNENYKRLQFNLTTIKISMYMYSDVICFNCKLKSINAFIIKNPKTNQIQAEDHNYDHDVLILTTNLNNENNAAKKQKQNVENFIQLVIQWPNGLTDMINKPPFLSLIMSNFQLTLNNEFVKFLSYDELQQNTNYEKEWLEEENQQLAQRQELETVESSRKSTVIHDQRTKRQYSHPQESVHLSSEKEDQKTSILQKSTKQKNNDQIDKKIGPILKCLVIWIDIKQSTVILIQKPSLSNGSSLDNSNYNSTKILLPSIQCKCKELNDHEEINIHFPISKAFHKWKPTKSTFPWLCQINDLSVKTLSPNEKYLIHPINANITLALDDKKYEKSSTVPQTSAAKQGTKLKHDKQQHEKDEQHEKKENGSFIKRKLKHDKQHHEKDEQHEKKESDSFLKGKLKHDKQHDEKDEQQQQEKESDSFLILNNILEEILAFNLHIDTKPIFMELSEDQAIVLHATLSLVMKSLELINYCREQCTMQNLPTDDIENDLQTIGNQDDATIKDVKDFLALNTNSEDNSSHTYTDYSLTKTNQQIILLLMQWTVTKITLSLKGSSSSIVTNKNNNDHHHHNAVDNDNLKTKINFDIEDFIVSVDYQIDYFKFKCKIGSLNMQYYKKEMIGNNVENEWKPSDYFKIKIHNTIITENTQHHLHHTNGDTFFDLTLTIAETSDYFKRLGVRRNLKNLNKSIAEIDMHIKGIDILFDIEKCFKFIPIINCITSIGSKEDQDNLFISSTTTELNEKRKKFSPSKLITDLPLLFAESQGITIYIPIRTGKSWCDVFIFKIGEMYITPLVKHPLARNPIRSDIYNKAAQLQILDIPGSKLEDRQYEFSIQNISIATGNWNDILNLMNENLIKLKNTNPAFEWNNYNQTIINNNHTIELNSIFDKFLITVTYAPYMLYKNILICGEIIEINCVNDLIITLNTDQLNIINMILDTIQNLNKINNLCRRNSVRDFHCQQEQQLQQQEEDQQCVLPQVLVQQSQLSKIETIKIKDDLKNQKYCKNNNISKQNDSQTTDSGIVTSITKNKTRNSDKRKYGNTIATNSSINNNPPHSKDHQHKDKDSIVVLNKITDFFIPYKIELIAGLFIINLLQNLRTNDNKKTLKKSQPNDNSNNDMNNDMNKKSITSPSSKSFELLIYPLLSLKMKTSMLIECKNNTEFLLKFFIYSISVDNGQQKTASATTSTDNDNNDHLQIIETLTGNLNSTGIPPPLLTFEYKIRKYNLNISQKIDIDLIFGRPLKFYLSTNIIKHLYKLHSIIMKTFLNEQNEIIKNVPSSSSSKLSIDSELINLNENLLQIKKLRKTKIQIIKKFLYNANKLSITTDKFYINLYNNNSNNKLNKLNNSYSLELCIGDINSILTIIDYPEKLTFYTIFDTFTIKINDHQFLHPIKFKIKLQLIQELWTINPVINLNFKFNLIHIDINFNNFQTLINIKNDFENLFNEINEKINEQTKTENNDNDNNDDEKLNLNKHLLLEKIHLPEPKRKLKKLHKEEFYQDDLRAGAFQFIELIDDKDLLNNNNSLPHPYQIQIISKNNGIVCWRYPQPRRICKLQIYPVPMDISQPLTIQCRMEYYSESHSDFLHYCNFNINEMEMNEIQLTNDKITAHIWRVIILQSVVTINQECFKESNLLDGDDIDDTMDDSDCININEILKDDKATGITMTPSFSSSSSSSFRKIKKSYSNNNHYILDPKSLVACMRIDTAFSPNYIPKIKCFINVSLIKINLQNQQLNNNDNNENNEIQLPNILKKFKLKNNQSNVLHTVLTLYITNTKLFMNFINNNDYTISTETILSLKCLDYCHLQMFNLIEDTNIMNTINIQNNNYDINIFMDTLKFNLTTTFLHTFDVTQKLWTQCIMGQHHNYYDKNIIIWSHYVICNHTQLMLRIGQSNNCKKCKSSDDNDEQNNMINIDSGNCIFYSFYSYHKNDQLIIQYMKKQNTNSDSSVSGSVGYKMITSCPIQIQNDGEQFILFNDNDENSEDNQKFLIIKIFQLSLTQKCILIKGQIDILSMTQLKFNIQFRSLRSYGSNNNHYPEVQINDYEQLSVIAKCVSNEELFFRLRFTETESDQVRWSGEIPLRSHRGLPWLVKIPTNKENPEFLSFWIRIIRENINTSSLSGSSSSTTSILNSKDFKPIRILIVIYPIFMMQSNFIKPLTTSINLSDHDHVELNGKGEIVEVRVAATHETQHAIKFENEFPAWHGEKCQSAAVLTFNNIDWDKFFWYDDKKININEFLNKTITQHLNKIKWPYTSEILNNENGNDNVIIERDIQVNQSVKNIIPFIKCLKQHDLSCSLMMNISPWCLLINRLNYDIEIKKHVTESSSSSSESTKQNDYDIIRINAGKIGMLFPIENSFYINLFSNDNISKMENCKNNYNKISIDTLQENSVITKIFTYDKFILRILIEYDSIDGIQIIMISSMFTIVNFSKHKFIAYPFCLINNGDNKIDRNYLESATKPHINIPKEMSKNSCAKGLSLDKFYNLKFNNYQNMITTQTPIKYFICLTIHNDELSLPLPLDETYNRKCFSLYLNGKSCPFAAICLEKKLSINKNLNDSLKSQYYLFIYDDTSPILLIDNQTHFSYYIAEANAIQPDKGTSVSSSNDDIDQRQHYEQQQLQQQTNIVPECNENLILWRNIIRPMCSTFYGPPSVYTTFPDTEKYYCDITLALKQDDRTILNSNNIRWTTPIHTGYRSEKYINIPLHGDVKIVVCDKHNTIRIFIFYVSQQTEFCIKDLRTRLQDPDKQKITENLNDNHHLHQKQDHYIDHQYNSNKKNRKIENLQKHKECQHKLPKFSIKLNLFANEISWHLWSNMINNKSSSSSSKSKLIKSNENREIFSFYIDDITLKFNNSFKTIEVYINNLQIDNQLYSTGQYDFPVILCSEKSYEKKSKLPNLLNLKKFIKQQKIDKPLFMLFISLYDDLTIETIHLQLNPLRIYLEDTFIFDLHNELSLNSDPSVPPSASLGIYSPNNNSNDNVIKCGAGEILIPKNILEQAVSLSELLKLRYIRIDPISANLSFHTSVKMYVGFDHSPLGFSQYNRRNLYTVPVRFEQNIGKHYVSGFLFSCGWVVGSLEFLGSPSGLARSFTNGIRDFVSMPVQGFFRGPWGFFIGISQGSVSLFRNVTAGALNSVTKLAVSVSRNLDRLTLDEEHLQRTEALRRSRPQGLTQGLSNGLTGLGINILGAIGGISRHTLEAKSTVGIVTGLGKGLFGAIAKPISGAADLVALTGQGMLHTVGYNTLPEQRNHGLMRSIIAYPAECKILWQLLPNMLAMNQILFYHEATLITGNNNDNNDNDDAGCRQLRHVQLILTTKILTVYDMEKEQLIDILPIERVEISLDNLDKTLIHIKLLQENDEGDDENSSFTNERIIRFLKASNDSLPSMTKYSLDDLLQRNQKVTKLKWSLYVSEDLGQHLFGYIKLIKSYKNT